MLPETWVVAVIVIAGVVASWAFKTGLDMVLAGQ